MTTEKYGKELAKEGENNEVFSGSWPLEQMSKRPYSIGFTDDKFEGIRKVEISELRYGVGLVGQTGYGCSAMLQNLAFQVHRDKSFVYINNFETQLRETLPEDELLEISTKEEKFDFTLDLFNSKMQKQNIEFIADLLFDIFGREYITATQINIIEKAVEIALHSSSVSTLKDFEDLFVEEESFENSVDSKLSNDFKETLDELSDEKLDSLLRRINTLVTDKELDKFIRSANNSYTLSEFAELIESTDVSILYNGNPGERLTSFFPQLVYRSINHFNKTETEKALFLDNMEAFDSSIFSFSKMMAKSRSLRLGVVARTLSLNQLDSDLSGALRANAGTFLVIGKAANMQEANLLSSSFEEYSRDFFLNELSPFKFAGSIRNKYGERKFLSGEIFPLIKSTDYSSITRS